MKILTLALGPFETNCYIAINKNGSSCIVDPADDPSAIMEALKENSATAKIILLTHGHFDHIMAAGKLSLETGAPIYIHELDAGKLLDDSQNLSEGFMGELNWSKPEEYKTLKDGDSLEMDDVTFDVIHTPGHTSGSVCYRCGGDVFTGDTVFTGSVGRTDMPDGDYDTLVNSLEKLKDSLEDEDYKIYPGHGKSTRWLFELDHNLYLSGMDQI